MEKENQNMVRAIFYFQDDFNNPHFMRKGYIGNIPKDVYKESIKTGYPCCFDVGSDYYAKNFPETIYK